MTSTTVFPTDLGIATRVGLTRGVGATTGLPASFGAAEARYREERLLAEAAWREHRRHARPGRRSHWSSLSQWAHWGNPAATIR